MSGSLIAVVRAPWLGAAIAGALVLALAPAHRPGSRRGPGDRGPGAAGRAVPRSGRWRGRGLPVAVGAVWVMVAAIVLGLVLTVAVVAAAGAAVVLVRRGRAQRESSARDRCLPELVDLFGLAASAGHPVASALQVVAPRAPVPVRPAVLAADARRRRGLPLDRCLSDLGIELGPTAAPLIDALRRSVATGAPLAPMLREVAAGAREQRRRVAEAAARRLPVTMLLPLTGCVLPAAVLLAVVPVVLVSLASLR